MLGQAMGGIGGQPMVQYQQQTQQVYQQSLGLQQVSVNTWNVWNIFNRKSNLINLNFIVWEY